MLSVWLTRAFHRDIVEHMARTCLPNARSGSAPSLSRGLVLGNATGLGVAPFLLVNTLLLHNWIEARETALPGYGALATIGLERKQCSTRSLREPARDRSWQVDERHPCGRGSPTHAATSFLIGR